MSTFLSALRAARSFATMATLVTDATLPLLLARSDLAFRDEELHALRDWLRRAQSIAATKEESPQLRELYAVLAQRGWVGLEDHIGAGEEGQILLEVRSNPPEWLDEAVCEGFRERDHATVREMTTRWWLVPYLLERRDVVEDAVKAHCEGRYGLSIPALLPLVEGLAAEIVEGSPGKPDKLIRRVAREYHKAEQEAWSECLVTVINEYLYKSFDLRSPDPPACLNRHAVMHGRSPHYASEANSLRTILVVDVFARFAIEKPELEEFARARQEMSKDAASGRP